MAKCPKCKQSNGGLFGGTCDSCYEADSKSKVTEYQARRERVEAESAAFASAMSALVQRTTAAFELPGHRITQSLGMVRGISVRSPKIGQGLVATIETIGGGENSALAKMCDDSRETALQRMWENAVKVGANAVIACRYDANEVAAGITEVLCYGTAVAIEPVQA